MALKRQKAIIFNNFYVMAVAIKIKNFSSNTFRECVCVLFLLFFFPHKVLINSYDNLTFTTLGNNYKGIQLNEQGSH